MLFCIEGTLADTTQMIIFEGSSAEWETLFRGYNFFTAVPVTKQATSLDVIVANVRKFMNFIYGLNPDVYDPVIRLHAQNMKALLEVEFEKVVIYEIDRITSDYMNPTIWVRTPDDYIELKVEANKFLADFLKAPIPNCVDEITFKVSNDLKLVRTPLSPLFAFYKDKLVPFGFC